MIINIIKILYFLSKLLPLFLMPLGASFAGFILSILFKSKNIFLFTLAFLYLNSIGITSDFLISYVEKPYEIVPLSEVNVADAIVVLSGMRNLERNQKIFEWKDPDRFFGGIRLYKAGKSKKLIFTGGYSPSSGINVSEGQLNKNDAILMGIPKNAILISDKANNTLQEAIEIRNLFKKKNFQSNEIILVTSAFHMQRAQRIFERYGFKIINYPVDFKSKCSKRRFIYNLNCFIPNAGSLNSSSLAIKELIGRIVYSFY